MVFDHFKAGITQCVPLSIRRIVFSAGDSDYLGRILELTERLLHIKEYQIEVFSRDLMQKLLIEPVIKRCDKFIVYEVGHYLPFFKFSFSNTTIIVQFWTIYFDF